MPRAIWALPARQSRQSPMIALLRRRAEETRLAEVERTLARMPRLSESDQARIEAMSKALVNRLLHDPVTRLRDAGNERHLDALHTLFDLDAKGEGGG